MAGMIEREDGTKIWILKGKRYFFSNKGIFGIRNGSLSFDQHLITD